MSVRDFARRAPVGRDGDTVPIQTRALVYNDIKLWKALIQPFIQKEPDPRADRNWPWSSLYASTKFLQRRSGVDGVGVTTFVESADGSAVPAAMSLLRRPYPHLPRGPGEDTEAVFVWFLSTAPRAALEALGVATRPSLGRVVLDQAMVLAERESIEGRIGLHCSPKGGDRLMDFYLNGCRLLQVPAGDPLPMRIRHNDGRWYYTSEERAQELLGEHDALRAPWRAGSK